MKCHLEEEGAGRERTWIIVPGDGGQHDVLLKSCRVCHDDNKAGFWILVVPPGKWPVPEKAPIVGKPPPPPPAAEKAAIEGFENPHDALDCHGCHKNESPEDLQGGVSILTGIDSEEVGKFCLRCHSGADQRHFPRGNLPGPSVSCLNCHQIKGRQLLYPALRPDYLQFLTAATGINPHGGKIFCLTCHRDSPQEGQPVNFLYPDDANRMCRRCHEGVEHHPLNVKSAPGSWKMDFANFPLQQEAVTCDTCHDPPECEGEARADSRHFLRGGPYDAVEEFCLRCHEGRKFAILNPHDQIDESGEVDKKKCLYCHVSVPDSTFDALTPQDFTDNLEALCASCHTVPAHPDVDHMVPLPSTKVADIRRYEERRLVVLPLDSDDKVTCATCHNPHEKGLLMGPAGVGADEEYRLRLATFNEICTPCHGRH